MSDGAYGPVYAKVAPRRPLQSGAIYDNVVPIARGAAAGKTLQALKVTINGFKLKPSSQRTQLRSLFESEQLSLVQ